MNKKTTSFIVEIPAYNFEYQKIDHGITSYWDVDLNIDQLDMIAEPIVTKNSYECGFNNSLEDGHRPSLCEWYFKYKDIYDGIKVHFKDNFSDIFKYEVKEIKISWESYLEPYYRYMRSNYYSYPNIIPDYSLTLVDDYKILETERYKSIMYLDIKDDVDKVFKNTWVHKLDLNILRNNLNKNIKLKLYVDPNYDEHEGGYFNFYNLKLIVFVDLISNKIPQPFEEPDNVSELVNTNLEFNDFVYLTNNNLRCNIDSYLDNLTLDNVLSFNLNDYGLFINNFELNCIKSYYDTTPTPDINIKQYDEVYYDIENEKGKKFDFEIIYNPIYKSSPETGMKLIIEFVNYVVDPDDYKSNIGYCELISKHKLVWIADFNVYNNNDYVYYNEIPKIFLKGYIEDHILPINKVITIVNDYTYELEKYKFEFNVINYNEPFFKIQYSHDGINWEDDDYNNNFMLDTDFYVRYILKIATHDINSQLEILTSINQFKEFNLIEIIKIDGQYNHEKGIWYIGDLINYFNNYNDTLELIIKLQNNIRGNKIFPLEYILNADIICLNQLCENYQYLSTTYTMIFYPLYGLEFTQNTPDNEPILCQTRGYNFELYLNFTQIRYLPLTEDVVIAIACVAADEYYVLKPDNVIGTPSLGTFSFPDIDPAPEYMYWTLTVDDLTNKNVSVLKLDITMDRDDIILPEHEYLQLQAYFDNNHDGYIGEAESSKFTVFRLSDLKYIYPTDDIRNNCGFVRGYTYDKIFTMLFFGRQCSNREKLEILFNLNYLIGFEIGNIDGSYDTDLDEWIIPEIENFKEYELSIGGTFNLICENIITAKLVNPITGVLDDDIKEFKFTINQEANLKISEILPIDKYVGDEIDISLILITADLHNVYEDDGTLIDCPSEVVFEFLYDKSILFPVDTPSDFDDQTGRFSIPIPDCNNFHTIEINFTMKAINGGYSNLEFNSDSDNKYYKGLHDDQDYHINIHID
jgi:hypothetical protein